MEDANLQLKQADGRVQHGRWEASFSWKRQNAEEDIRERKSKDLIQHERCRKGGTLTQTTQPC